MKPPVETVALWSPRDGVIAPRSASGRPGERDRAIALRCTHLGFASSHEAIRAVATELEAIAGAVRALPFDNLVVDGGSCSLRRGLRNLHQLLSRRENGRNGFPAAPLSCTWDWRKDDAKMPDGVAAAGVVH